MKSLPTLFHAVAVALASLKSDLVQGFARSNLARRTPKAACTTYIDAGCIGIGNSGYHPRDASPLLDTRTTTISLSSSSGNNGNNESESEAFSIRPILDRITSNPTKSLNFSILMALCGAALGPFLDSYHSLFGVLSYDTPLTFPILGSIEDGYPELLSCVTTYWVPPLFGLAGFLIGWLYVGLDAAMLSVANNDDYGVVSDENIDARLQPTVPKVLLGISYFTFQYWLSGILFAHGVERTPILVLMTALAGGGFFALDGTLSGFVTSAATAVGGPLIEVGLISSLSGGWGYHYNDPGETGFFPLWIVPVYFLGGPANGNLARAFWNALGDDADVERRQSRTEGEKSGIPCPNCGGTRAVPCPNCDGEGSYITYGERVICKACRGKGRVICRTCFGQYGDDPNDIENIRRIMDRIPD